MIWICYATELGLILMRWRATRIAPHTATLVIDALAVAVPMLAVALPSGSPDSGIFCAIWLLKPLRDLAAFRLVLRVIGNEAHNLFGVLSIFAIILFFASIAAFLLERSVQPDAFGSIPQAMWWAITTLTTTGYGDKIPQTLAGRMLAGFVMMCGIGVFALWAGILATGFAEELRRRDFTMVWQLVARVPLFADLPHRDLAEIVKALKPRRASAGATIVQKGDVGTEMFFILEGSVQVVGADPPVLLGPGDYFGEMSLVSGQPRLATIVATAPTALLVLHIADFEVLIDRNATVAESIRRTDADRRKAHAGV